MGRDLSESPVRGRRRSSSRRERSPARRRRYSVSRSPSPRVRRVKGSRELERSYSRGSDKGSSPKRGRLRDSVSPSPSPRSRRLRRAKEDVGIEKSSLKRGRSRASLSRSPSPRSRRLRRGKEDEEIEKSLPKRGRSRASLSQSPSPTPRRLRRGQEEKEYERSNSKGSDGEKKMSRNMSRKDVASESPDSRSLSPRSRRLRRVQVEKVADRERDRSSGRGSENHRHKVRDRDTEREFERERKEKMSGRDEIDDNIRQRRSASPPNGHRRSTHRSRSPQPSHSHDEGPGSSGGEQRNDDDDSVAKMKAAEEALQSKDKHKPSFELSGKLAAETNRFRGVTLLFNEPSDARKPTVRWRLYVFKGGEVLNEPLYIHRQSCYLFGRERRVADIPTDHPSCSKQHAVIQYRQVEKEQPDGTLSKQVMPYLMDLGSTNKTFLNDNPIEPQRYYELFEKDTIKFGNSSREYVLLHENSVQ